MAWWQAVLAACGGALTIIGTVSTAAFAWKASTHATDKTSEIQEQATSISGFDLLVKSIQAERVEDRARLANVETKLGAAEIRITALEADLRKERTLVGQLLDYARRLRATLREHHIEIPDPPFEVRDKL